MYNEAELVHWMQNPDKVLLPAQVDIDLTNICNQDCYYCNSAEHRKTSPVQKEYSEYITLLDRVASWRAHSSNSYGTTHTITYPGGGEPTVLTGYEHVIEHTIDLGFLTSLTTNGTKLHKMLDAVDPVKLKKMAWIGVDIDAGSEGLYEEIRHSLGGASWFEQVKQNVLTATTMGLNVDLKCLVNPYNDNEQAVNDLFAYAKDVNARSLHIRPVIYNNEAHSISTEYRSWCVQASSKSGVTYRINTSKNEPRKYYKCHQMYHFPVFCADGYIYLCCDNKGVPEFSLGRWDQDDFRDQWMNSRHHKIYNQTMVQMCKPCRPNHTNNKIQDILDNSQMLEVLYL
jgi:sulfatase maturation enzyme AslB (radical SAM superfamily)